MDILTFNNETERPPTTSQKTFSIFVREHEDPTIYRDRILTALFNSGAVHEKVENVCFRSGVKKYSYIHEDLLQEVFYWLSRKPAKEVITMYEDNPARLIGLSVRIAVLKGAAKEGPNRINNPKHSLIGYILHTSNLRAAGPINFEGKEEADAVGWEEIYNALPEDHRAFMHTIFHAAPKGKRPKAVALNYNTLITNIMATGQNLGYKIAQNG